MRLRFIIFQYLLAVASAVLLFSESQFAIPTAPAARISGRIQAIADFDGDVKPDYVTTHPGGNGYRISVWLSTRSEATVLRSSASPAGSLIRACDINHDSYPDIVVAGAVTLNPLQVWLGNGKGRFEAADRNLLGSDFDFEGSPAIRPFSSQPGLDLIADSSSPDFDGIFTAVKATVLLPQAFLSTRDCARTLQVSFYSAVPRSPPGCILIY